MSFGHGCSISKHKVFGDNKRAQARMHARTHAGTLVHEGLFYSGDSQKCLKFEESQREVTVVVGSVNKSDEQSHVTL